MEPTQKQMAEAMDERDLQRSRDAHGRERQRRAEDHRPTRCSEALVAQIASAVRWVDCVQTLVSNGCDRFLELGSGRTLSGLVRQIDSEVETFSADSPKKLAKFAERASA